MKFKIIPANNNKMEKKKTIATNEDNKVKENITETIGSKCLS